MITFIFNIAQQGRNNDVPRQVSVLVELKGDIDSATASLPCPNHKSDSRASILLSGFRYGCKWEILDSCCEEFTRAIESAMMPCGEESELNLSS